MITGLGFGLEHTVLEPIPGFDTVPERDRRTDRIISSLLHVSIATDVNSCQLTHDKNRGYATKQCRLTSDVRANSS